MSQSRVQTIDVSRLNNEVKFSEVFSTINYIPLETTENCYLTYITQIQFDDSLIFVQDKRRDEIFVFDLNGHFLNRIGEIGKGPGEILQYGDFHIDNTKKVIEVHDVGGNYLYYYSYSGELLETKMMMWASSFEKTTSNKYLLYSGYSNGFIDLKDRKMTSPIALVNTQGKIIERFKNQFKPICYGIPGIMSNNAITRYYDTLIVCPNRSNIIYQLWDDVLYPRYKLDFGSRELPPKYLKLENLHSSHFYSWQSKYVFEVYDFLECDNSLAFHFPMNGVSYQGFVNKKDFSVKVAGRNNFINDIDGIKPKYFAIKAKYRDCFVAYMQSNDFKEQVELINRESVKGNNDCVRASERLMLLNNSIENNDNPIIIFYKTKMTYE